ncbi:MAG: NAD(P)/FAD-dependent oxidoreductase [Polyangiaceae bacterium]
MTSADAVRETESTESRATRSAQGSANKKRAHTPVPERVDVAIVGSGPGGLVSAAYLAAAGLKVAVFEAHYTAGGCVTQFSRGPRSARWNFDVGLHYVGDCRADGTIPRILSDLGVSVDFAELDPNGFDTLAFPDFKFAIPADLDLYRDRLVAMFPHERRGIDGYVKLVRAVMKLSRMMDVHEGHRPPVTELARVALDAVRLAPHQKATIGEVLGGLVKDERVAAVMLGQSGDYGLPPSRASALLHMGLAGHYFRGAFYPKGGGQVIADRIADRIEALGGTVHVRTPVEKIIIEGGRAVGVRLAAKAGEPAMDVRADLVISNADLKRTLLELVGPEHLPGSWITRTNRFEMAAALFLTFVGMKGDGRELGMTSSNIWQFDGYDAERFYRETNGETPSMPRGCYITSASLKDPANGAHHAPAGHTNVEVMCIVPSSPAWWGASRDEKGWGYKHEARYLERKSEIEADMVARLDRLFPGAAERVVLRESATPMTHTRFTGASDGTGYGLAGTPQQFMKARPGYRGPLPGLYFVGASLRAGHGVVGAMMGGRAAARRILADVRARAAASVRI